MKPPLHIHLLAHPQSDTADQIAQALLARLMEPPVSGGLRVPVFFTPDRGDGLPPALAGEGALDLDAAQHTLVVVLADERMVRTVAGGTGAQWQNFVRKLQQDTPLNASAHHLLPVALDGAGFQIHDQVHVLPAPLDPTLTPDQAQARRLAHLSFHIAARALQLLEHGKVPAVAPNRMQAPVHIFLSHAKADLSQDRNDPVHSTAKACNDKDFCIDDWFDSRNIAPSQNFAAAIQAGIRDCSIMLAFQTDHYSARPWCRREVLDAKRLGAHVLMVNAVENGEPRSFPYGGNVPVIRWNLGGNADVEARRVLDRAVLEALRFKHNRAVLQNLTEPGEQILPTAPEALTLAELPDSAASYLYPDPPLGREELEILTKLRPAIHLTTPLTRLAARSRLRNVSTITVSISESGDARRYGLSDAHIATLSDELHLYLLLAGLNIAYGGALSGDFAKGSNFTLRLFELVRSYSRLAEDVAAKPLKGAIRNVAPWPLWLNYGEAEWALFGDIAGYAPVARPDLPWSDDALFPVAADGKRTLTPNTPTRRYAWARGLTAMRQEITASSQARLVLGGKLENFSGLIPGVIEEAWASLQAGKPLYLIGGFGGAARAVCDLLQGVHRPEFDAAWPAAHIADYAAAVACHPPQATPLVLLPTIGQQIAARTGPAPDLGAVLKNGLNDHENRELMHSTDVQRIAHLVLTGLGRLQAVL